MTRRFVPWRIFVVYAVFYIFHSSTTSRALNHGLDDSKTVYQHFPPYFAATTSSQENSSTTAPLPTPLTLNQSTLQKGNTSPNNDSFLHVSLQQVEISNMSGKNNNTAFSDALSDQFAVDSNEANDTQTEPRSEDDLVNRQALISRVASLRRRSTHMKNLITITRQSNLEASIMLQQAKQRRSYLHNAKHDLERDRILAEHHLAQIRGTLPTYRQTLQVLNRQAGNAILEIARLRQNQHSVIGDKLRLLDDFQHHGLEHWVENALKGSVNPLVADAFIEGTANVVEPLLEIIERVAAVNSELTNSLQHTIPIVERPFYSGFVTTIVLLCPLVLVLSVLLKIKRGISRLTCVHAIILGNFYFLLMSGGCFIATVLGGVDVLETFRHANLRLFDSVMVLHALIFTSHFCFHGVVLVQSQDDRSIIHVVLLSIIATHFFLHSYSHALRNEDPHVDKLAYFAYTIAYVYILYDLTLRQLLDIEDVSMKLNNTSISSKPAPEERRRGGAGAADVTRSTVLRLPERRAIANIDRAANERVGLDTHGGVGSSEAVSHGGKARIEMGCDGVNKGDTCLAMNEESKMKMWGDQV